MNTGVRSLTEQQDGELSSEDAAILLECQRASERETRGRRELEEAYCSGYDSGFMDGVIAGAEKAECETWDEAYNAGYRAAVEEGERRE